MPNDPQRHKKDHDILLLRQAVGMALVSIRERQRLRQQDVAQQVQTTRGHLSRMERGRGDPSLSMVWRLSAVLKISPVALVREVLKNYQNLKKG